MLAAFYRPPLLLLHKPTSMLLLRLANHLHPADDVLQFLPRDRMPVRF